MITEEKQKQQQQQLQQDGGRPDDKGKSIADRYGVDYPYDAPLDRLSGVEWLRARVYLMLDGAHVRKNVVNKMMAILVMLLILISSVCFVLETVPEWSDWEGWFTIEAIVSVAFTIEYFCRLICSRNALVFCFR